MSNQSRYRRIVVPIDGSGWSQRAIPHAVDIALGHNSKIILLQVYKSPVREFTDQLVLAGQATQMDETRAAAEATLAGLCSEVRLRGVEATPALVDGTDVAETICAYVNANAVDLVVMTTHGRSGLARLLFGSVAKAIMECLAIPVLLVHPDRE